MEADQPQINVRSTSDQLVGMYSASAGRSAAEMKADNGNAVLPSAHWHCASTRRDHPESCTNTDDTSGTRGSTPSNVVHSVVVMAKSAAEAQHV